jgi:very-short-patch-repair endonuclease
MYIKQFLDKNNIKNKPERTIFIGDNYYRFDFYLPQYNLFIEYDGEQHFKPIRYYTQTEEEMMDAFKKTQEHDRIKNKYCEDNQINLLRIPYWEKENIETIINNHLQRLSIEDYIAEAV